MERGRDEFVCVPSDGPRTPESVINLARAAVRDGVGTSFAITYGEFYYELELMNDSITGYLGHNFWAILRWTVRHPYAGLVPRLPMAEQAHGTDQAGSSEQAEQAHG